MKVTDVMTKDVVTVGTEAPYKEIVTLMLEHDVTGVPVVDADGHLVGIVTEADLADKQAYAGHSRRLLALVHDFFTGPAFESVRKAEALTASGLMTKKPLIVTAEDDVTVAAQRMLEMKVKRLPVLDDNGALVGIVSRRDLLRGYARSDRDVENDVVARLHSIRFVPETIEVDRISVFDGVVELHGTVEFPSDLRVVEGSVRSVPGVVAVNSHLVAREPDPDLTSIAFPIR